MLFASVLIGQSNYFGIGLGKQTRDNFAIGFASS